MGRMGIEWVVEEMLNCHVKLTMKCSFIHVKLQLLYAVLFVQVFLCFKLCIHYCVSKMYNYTYTR